MGGSRLTPAHLCSSGLAYVPRVAINDVRASLLIGLDHSLNISHEVSPDVVAMEELDQRVRAGLEPADEGLAVCQPRFRVAASDRRNGNGSKETGKEV